MCQYFDFEMVAWANCRRKNLELVALVQTKRLVTREGLKRIYQNFLHGFATSDTNPGFVTVHRNNKILYALYRTL